MIQKFRRAMLSFMNLRTSYGRYYSQNEKSTKWKKCLQIIFIMKNFHQEYIAGIVETARWALVHALIPRAHMMEEENRFPKTVL